MIGRNKITKSVLADSPNKYTRNSSNKKRPSGNPHDSDCQDNQTEKIQSRKSERDHPHTVPAQQTTETIVINRAGDERQQFDPNQMLPSAPSAPLQSEEMNDQTSAPYNQFPAKYSVDNYDLIMVSGQNSGEKSKTGRTGLMQIEDDQKGSISGVSMKDPLMTDRIPSDEVHSSNDPSANKLNLNSSYPSHKLAVVPVNFNSTQPIVGFGNRVNQQNVVLPLKTSNIKIQRVGWQNQGNANPSIMQNSFMQQSMNHGAYKKRTHRFSSGFNKDNYGGADYRERQASYHYQQQSNPQRFVHAQELGGTVSASSRQRGGGALSSTMQTLLGSPSPTHALNRPPQNRQSSKDPQIVMSTNESPRSRERERGHVRSIPDSAAAGQRSRTNTDYQGIQDVHVIGNGGGVGKRTKTAAVAEEPSYKAGSSVGQISPLRDGKFEHTNPSTVTTQRTGGKGRSDAPGSPRFQMAPIGIEKISETPQFRVQGVYVAHEQDLNVELDPIIKNSNPYLITSYEVPKRKMTAADAQHQHAFRGQGEKSLSPQGDPNQKNEKKATQYLKVHSSTHGASTATDIQDESETMNISRLGGCVTTGSAINAGVVSEPESCSTNFLHQMIHPISIASKTNYNKVNVGKDNINVTSKQTTLHPQTEHQTKRPQKYKQLRGLCIDNTPVAGPPGAKKIAMEQQTDAVLFRQEPRTQRAGAVAVISCRRNNNYDNHLSATAQHTKGFAGGFGGAGQVYRKLAGIETTNRNYGEPDTANTYVATKISSQAHPSSRQGPHSTPNTSPIARQNTAPQNQYETVDLQLTGNKALLTPAFYVQEEESRNRAMITFSTDEANMNNQVVHHRGQTRHHMHASQVGVEISRTHGNSTVDGLSADVSREHRLEAKEFQANKAGQYRASQEMEMSETQEHPIVEEVSDQAFVGTRKAIFSSNRGESDYHDSQRQSSTRQRRIGPDVLEKAHTQEIDHEQYNSGCNTPKEDITDNGDTKQRGTELGKTIVDASGSDLNQTQMYSTHKPTVTSVTVKKHADPAPHIDIKQDSLYIRQSASRRSSAEIISIMRSEEKNGLHELVDEGMTERLPAHDVSYNKKNAEKEYYGIRVSSNKVMDEGGQRTSDNEDAASNPMEGEAFKRFQEEGRALGVVGSRYKAVALYGDYQSRVSSMIAQPRKKIVIQAGSGPNEDLDAGFDPQKRAPIAGFPPSPVKQTVGFGSESNTDRLIGMRRSPGKDKDASDRKTPFERSREARLDRSLGEFLARRVQDFLLIQERLQKKSSPKKTEIQSQLLAGQLLKEVAYIQRKQKKGQVCEGQFTDLEKRDIGMGKLEIAKPPRSFIRFKNKSEEYRYMRIVHQLQQLENETHETFVKNLLSTCRNDTNKIINEEDRYQPDQDWMEERMMFFTEELDHAYERIFRFLKDMLTPEEYDQVDYVAVTRFIEQVQAVQRAAAHYEKPDLEGLRARRARNSQVDPNLSVGGGVAEFSMSQDSQAFSAKYKIRQESQYDLYSPSNNQPQGVASNNAFDFQRPAQIQATTGKSFASQARLGQQSYRQSPALSSPVHRPQEETANFTIRQSESNTLGMEQELGEPALPTLHQFICEGLGIRLTSRGHSKSAFTHFAVHERDDPLWANYTFGKDIDLGKVYESRRLQNDEQIRKGFVDMRHQERNANLQNRLLKHLVSESHESNLPVVMQTNHYGRSDKLNQPLLQHMQKRTRQKLKGRSRDIWTDRGQPSTKNSFVSVDVQRLAVDSSMRRNSLLLERVLLERNMAGWKTQILHQIHGERNNAT